MGLSGDRHPGENNICCPLCQRNSPGRKACQLIGDEGILWPRGFSSVSSQAWIAGCGDVALFSGNWEVRPKLLPHGWGSEASGHYGHRPEQSTPPSLRGVTRASQAQLWDLLLPTVLPPPSTLTDRTAIISLGWDPGCESSWAAITNQPLLL